MMEKNRRRSFDDIDAFVLNMRYCCEDIEIDEDSDDECSNHCLDCRDCREEGARFCRQWLVHDAADLIENLVAKLQVERERCEQAYCQVKALRLKVDSLEARHEENV